MRHDGGARIAKRGGTVLPSSVRPCLFGQVVESWRHGLVEDSKTVAPRISKDVNLADLAVPNTFYLGLTIGVSTSMICALGRDRSTEIGCDVSALPMFPAASRYITRT